MGPDVIVPYVMVTRLSPAMYWEIATGSQQVGYTSKQGADGGGNWKICSVLSVGCARTTVLTVFKVRW